VIHLDAQIPSPLALALVHRLMKQHAEHQVMVCSSSLQTAREAFLAGANVCIHLPCEDPKLEDALGYLLRGDMYVDAAVMSADASPSPAPPPRYASPPSIRVRVEAAAVDSEFSEEDLDGSGFRDLTTRERQIAALLKNGLSTKEIASQLDISPYTVSTHVKHIYRKLDVSSRPQLRKKFGTGYGAGTFTPPTVR
jgi:DNA-binding NarL/FixJ family response regulator